MPESSETSMSSKDLKLPKSWQQRRDEAILEQKTAGFKNQSRELELEPKELARRIDILRAYLQLLIETKYSTGRAMTDAQIVDMQQVGGSLSSYLYFDSLLVVRDDALKMGLTYQEVFDLSHDPDWQYLVIHPTSPVIGAVPLGGD